MLDWLKGPESLSTYEKQFIRERLQGKTYKPRSYFRGATPANNYTPSTPYKFTPESNPYTFQNSGWATIWVRSGGADILSESVVMQRLPDGRDLPVTEIRSVFRGNPILTFVWYTGPEETTGSFFAFRRKWSPADQWFSYQIVTEVFNGNESAARAFLLETLSKF